MGATGFSEAISAVCFASRAAASAARAAKRTLSPGRSWPIFHSSACDDRRRADEAAEAGPSGPRMIGMSPVKSIVPMA